MERERRGVLKEYRGSTWGVKGEYMGRDRARRTTASTCRTNGSTRRTKGSATIPLNCYANN